MVFFDVTPVLEKLEQLGVVDPRLEQIVGDKIYIGDQEKDVLVYVFDPDWEQIIQGDQLIAVMFLFAKDGTEERMPPFGARGLTRRSWLTKLLGEESFNEHHRI